MGSFVLCIEVGSGHARLGRQSSGEVMWGWPRLTPTWCTAGRHSLSVSLQLDIALRLAYCPRLGEEVTSSAPNPASRAVGITVCVQAAPRVAFLWQPEQRNTPSRRQCDASGGTHRHRDSGADLRVAPCTAWVAEHRVTWGDPVEADISDSSFGAVVPGWAPLTSQKASDLKLRSRV